MNFPHSPDSLQNAPSCLSDIIFEMDVKVEQTKTGADESYLLISHLIRQNLPHQHSWPTCHIKQSVGVDASILISMMER